MKESVLRRLVARPIGFVATAGGGRGQRPEPSEEQVLVARWQPAADGRGLVTVWTRQPGDTARAVRLTSEETIDPDHAWLRKELIA